jgi:uracil-DNA glycosylase family 4
MEIQQLRASKNTQESCDPAQYLLARADAVAGVPCMPRSTAVAGRSPEAMQSPADAMAAIQAAAEVFFESCESCGDAERCVFGEGNPSATIVFVGGVPSQEDEQAGQPIAGPAGQKLNDILKAMKLSRSDVYLTTIVKAHLPECRMPRANELTEWLPWFHRQLRIIQPDIIVALGRIAAEAVLQTPVDIASLRGKMGEWVDPETGQQISVMPTFHPAYLLEHYTPEVRGQVWDDMKGVLAAVRGSASQ